MVRTSQTARNSIGLLRKVDQFIDSVVPNRSAEEAVQEQDIPEEELDLTRKVEQVEALLDKIEEKDDELIKQISKKKGKYKNKIGKANEADQIHADRHKRDALRLRKSRRRKRKLHNELLDRYEFLLNYLDKAKEARERMELDRELADIDLAIEQLRDRVEDLEDDRRELDMKMDELDDVEFFDTDRPEWDEIQRDIAREGTEDIGEDLNIDDVRPQEEDRDDDDEDDEFAYEGR
jgi:DNA repair exonuclease SbcCD ATPase subunit